MNKVNHVYTIKEALRINHTKKYSLSFTCNICEIKKGLSMKDHRYDICKDCVKKNYEKILEMDKKVKCVLTSVGM